MHLVHYSTEYTDLNTAAANPGGVAVLGVLFEVSRKNNKNNTKPRHKKKVS